MHSDEHLPDPQSPIRVSVIDQEALLREAFASVLEGAGFDTAGETADVGAPLTQALAARKPDVVVVGPGTVPSVLALLPVLFDQWPTIIITAPGDQLAQTSAIQLGVRGIVTTERSANAVVQAVLKVHAGEYWLDRARMAGLMTSLRRTRGSPDPETMKVTSLTPRERDIVALVAEGLTNADVAARLSIRESTARNHLTSILDKLELPNRFQLAVYSLRRGLVALPQQSSQLRLSTIDEEPAARQSGAR
jgi:DNA-binding NarL/FixJ family response regulator